MKWKCNLGSPAELEHVHLKASYFTIKECFSVTQKSSVVPQLPPSMVEIAATQQELASLLH